MTIDSNILIAYLNGEQRVVETLRGWTEEGRTLFISSVSVCEVLSLPRLDYAGIEKAKTFLDGFFSVPLDNSVAETTASLRRIYRLAFPDAAIAATALKYGVPLVTRDQDFRAVKEVQIVEI